MSSPLKLGGVDQARTALRRPAPPVVVRRARPSHGTRRPASVHRIEWIDDPARFAALREQWDWLAARQPSPFGRHAWYSAWWNAFGSGRRAQGLRGLARPAPGGRASAVATGRSAAGHGERAHAGLRGARVRPQGSRSGVHRGARCGAGGARDRGACLDGLGPSRPGQGLPRGTARGAGGVAPHVADHRPERRLRRLQETSSDALSQTGQARAEDAARPRGECRPARGPQGPRGRARPRLRARGRRVEGRSRNSDRLSQGDGPLLPVGGQRIPPASASFGCPRSFWTASWRPSTSACCTQAASGP